MIIIIDVIYSFIDSVLYCSERDVDGASSIKCSVVLFLFMLILLL